MTTDKEETMMNPLVAHDKVISKSIPGGQKAATMESRSSSRASCVYCNDAKIYMHEQKWHYYRDSSLPMDDPNTVCGTDHMTLDYDEDDKLTALSHCPNGKEKFKISW